MNFVPGAFCSLEKSMVKFSGTTISVINVFNASLESYFIALVYISVKKVSLVKTWAYIFPYNDLVRPFIVSDSHIPSNRFFLNILSAWYLRDNGITSDNISCCIVIFSVSFSCSNPICHRLLRSSGDIYEWCPLDWNIFACVTSCNASPTWDNFIDIDRTLTVAINLCDRVPVSYRDWFSGSLSYFPPKRDFHLILNIQVFPWNLLHSTQSFWEVNVLFIPFVFWKYDGMWETMELSVG